MGPLMICNAVEVILRVYEAKRPVKGSKVVDGGAGGPRESRGHSGRI